MEGIGKIDREIKLILSHFLTFEDMDKLKTFIRHTNISSWKISLDKKKLEIIIEINHVKYSCICRCGSYNSNNCTGFKTKKLRKNRMKIIETHYKVFKFKTTSGIYIINNSNDLLTWIEQYKYIYDIQHVIKNIENIRKLGKIVHIAISYGKLSIIIVTYNIQCILINLIRKI